MAYSTNGISWTDDGVDHAPFVGGCAISFAATTLADWTFSVTNPTLYFRIYPFNASSGAGTIQIYDLHIEGNVHLACTKPVVSVTPAADSFCSGGTGVSLTASGAGVGGVYTWSPSTGLSATTGASITATPVISTVYSVVGTTSLGCKDTIAVTVKVIPLPVAGIITSGTSTFCTGDSVVLTTGAGAGYTYKWFAGTTAIPGATNTRFVARTAGSYSVEITNGSGCIAVSAPEIVAVNPLPTVVITPSGPTAFCPGGNVTLTATTTTGVIFQWYRLGTLISGAVSSSYIADTTSAYMVKVKDLFGCQSYSPFFVTTVVPKPVILQNDTTFCGGNSIPLKLNVSGITGLIYDWQYNNVSIKGAIYDTYLAGAAGSYSCSVFVTGSCTMKSDTVQVNVLPVKVPVISITNGTYSTTKGYASYQWYLNTTAISGATTTTWKPRMNGNYRVRVIDTNGCVTYSIAYVMATVGFSNLNTTELAIYPNPASSFVHVESSEHLKVVLTGIDGRTISEHTVARDIDISTLPNGVYIIMLYDDSGRRVKVEKIVKQ